MPRSGDLADEAGPSVSRELGDLFFLIPSRREEILWGRAVISCEVLLITPLNLYCFFVQPVSAGWPRFWEVTGG